MSRTRHIERALDAAYVAADELLGDRTSNAAAHDETMLAVVSPLFAVARPASTLRTLDWKTAAGMLARGELTLACLV